MSVLLDILKKGYDQEASDVHFRCEEPAWFRIFGEIAPATEEFFSNETLYNLLAAVVPETKKASFHEGREVDFALDMPGIARFRVNLYHDLKGIAACFRILPVKIRNANELKLEPGILELCTRSKGLILITGPTGSGKSTTMASMLDYINLLRNDHIITIEEPIEFVHSDKNCLVNQREVDTHTVSFSRALRAALREDPDVVLVGAMRDLETTMVALDVAETGHLVLSTLHTNSAASTIYRIINQFPKKKQEQIRVALASSLIGVISQVLVPKAHEKGRVAAREVILVNHAIANLIRENKIYQIPSILQMNRKNGMVTMQDSLLDLVERGEITVKSALDKTSDHDSFKKALLAKGLK
jgi:twitching motility protein PilT